MVTWLALAPMACGGGIAKTAGGEADAATLQEAGMGGSITLVGSSSGGGSSASDRSTGGGGPSGSGGSRLGGGPGSGGGSSSGGSDGLTADAAGDEATVVEPDGATVIGVTYGNPVKFPTCIAGNGSIQAGYLFAAPVNLPSTGTVQGLGLITENSTVATYPFRGWVERVRRVVGIGRA